MNTRRVRISIDQALFKEASDLTGVSRKSALVRLGLEALVARESARRLAAPGRTE